MSSKISASAPRREKMPLKVFYNLDKLTSPRADPTKLIVGKPFEKNRVSRDRVKLEKNASTIRKCFNSDIDLSVTYT